jgi:hypothetical protein
MILLLLDLPGNILADLARTTSGKVTYLRAKFVQNIDPNVRKPMKKSLFVRLSDIEPWLLFKTMNLFHIR